MGLRPQFKQLVKKHPSPLPAALQGLLKGVFAGKLGDLDHTSFKNSKEAQNCLRQNSERFLKDLKGDMNYVSGRFKLAWKALKTKVKKRLLFNKFKLDQNDKSSKFYRYINEIPTLLLILIIFVVIFKPI